MDPFSSFQYLPYGSRTRLIFIDLLTDSSFRYLVWRFTYRFQADPLARWGRCINEETQQVDWGITHEIVTGGLKYINKINTPYIRIFTDLSYCDCVVNVTSRGCQSSFGESNHNFNYWIAIKSHNLCCCFYCSSLDVYLYLRKPSILISL